QAGLAHFRRLHLAEFQDVALRVVVDVGLTRAVAALAAVDRGRRARVLRLRVRRAFERVGLVGVTGLARLAAGVAGRWRRRLRRGPRCLCDGELLAGAGAGLRRPSGAHRNRDRPDTDRREPPSELHLSTSFARAWHCVGPTWCALVHSGLTRHVIAGPAGNSRVRTTPG